MRGSDDHVRLKAPGKMRDDVNFGEVRMAVACDRDAREVTLADENHAEERRRAPHVCTKEEPLGNQSLLLLSGALYLSY
jgi:hypothetical protein